MSDSPPFDNNVDHDNICISKQHFKNMIQKFKQRPELLDECLKKIYRVMKEYPPALNENKFLYGKLGEKILIHYFNMLTPCCELDAGVSSGASYLNDVHFSKYDMCCSIKMSKTGSEVTLINKYKRDTHSIMGACFIICNLKKHNIYFIVHTIELDEFVKQNGAGIFYRGKIFSYLDRHQRDMILPFPCGHDFQSFREHAYQHIQERSIYEEEFKRLMDIDDMARPGKV